MTPDHLVAIIDGADWREAIPDHLVANCGPAGV